MADLLPEGPATHEPAAVTVDDSCEWALRVMSAAGVDVLPVLEGARVVGIVRDREIYRLAATGSASRSGERSFLAHARVAGVMTYCPMTILPETTLRDAVALVASSEIAALPIIEKGRLLAVMTPYELLRSMLGLLDRGEPDDA